MYNIKKIGMVTILLYLVSLGIFFFYCKVELDKVLSFGVTERVMLNVIGFVCIYFGSILWAKSVDKSTSDKIMRITFIIGLTIYLVLLFTITLFDGYLERNGGNIFTVDEIYRKCFLEFKINLIPMKTILHYFKGTVNLSIAILNVLGNFCMFMPFAFFLPLISTKVRGWKIFFIAISSVVILIEVLQLVIMCGSLDIDDYILNVSGAFAIYFILKSPFLKNILEKITLIEIRQV